jgi:hypothetical protein
MSKKGICVFCGAYGDSNEEHFIAQRFRDLFPVQTSPDYGQRFSTYDNELRRYRVDVDRKPRSPWNMTVRVGEKCCNESWMAALDTRAAPVLNEALTTRSRLFTQSQLHALAAWAAKVSALHELARHATDGTPTAITLEDRRHVRRHRRPPFGTRVWLAAGEWHQDALPSIDQTTFRMFTKEVGRPPDDRRDTHSTTIYFGHLVLQVYGTTSQTLLKPNGPFQEHSAQIWPDPPRGGVMWPAKLFTEQEVKGLARSIEQSLTGRIASIGPT